VFRKIVSHVVFHPVTVNGEPGVASFYDGHLFAVMTLRTDGHRILDVFSILNPDKLRGITLQGIER
jgi:hypothetical protein